MSKEPGDVVQRVTVVDFDMEFWTLVKFLVKIALASIPALLILLLFAIFVAVVLGLTGNMMGT